MIHFSCSRCGQKFKVKPDFAGRATKCPTCKQALTVPEPDRTAAYVPNEKIEGTPSSVAKVGIDGGVTLGGDGASAGPVQKSVKELLARRGKSGERYLIESEIARGGMGAVLRAVDCDIRREVAVKYLLKQADARNKARFVEEAQITGQLEHPNIPPVHELGVDKDKRVFFAMKMVRGRSLAQVLDELRKYPKQAEKEWPLSRLLNIFVNICNALSYAHARGVIHRDLKPANVMVGDFGEVYVMDWGLAKVLDGQSAAVAGLAPSVIPMSGSSPGKIATSREADADLTQEGTILGTPAYMPPEQAMGKIDAIDARSDIYSLGAILYEMLTLQSPVEKDGGYLAILMRVSEGEIVVPEQRNSSRSIPRELSAIAMKALAKEAEKRYQLVEALRKDIERFQEGKSVSAKQDSFKEMAWKLVKRNKLASAFTTLLALVLVWSSVINFIARHEAEKANEKVRTRTEKAVPALVQSARLLGAEGQFEEALEQADLALDYDPKYVDAKLLKGQLYLAQKKFDAGHAELEQFVQQRPDDAEAKKLLELSATGKKDNPAVLFAVAQVFQRQKVSGLAVPLFKDVERSVKAREPVLQVYRNRINEAWPGLGDRLTLGQNGEFALDLQDCKQVASLDPLKGMDLSNLSLRFCDRVADLTPLIGMPLNSLDLWYCVQVQDLTPLQGLKLTSLNLTLCGRVKDLSPLKGMPLSALRLNVCPQIHDLSPLTEMPLTELYLGNCSGVSDLTPLQGMRLVSLELRYTAVRDLKPLKQMPLTFLDIADCDQVSDLTPLEDSQRKGYRAWVFDSTGTAAASSGIWDEDAKTLTWKGDFGNDITVMSTVRFVGNDTIEWKMDAKDKDGKVYLDMEGKFMRGR